MSYGRTRIEMKTPDDLRRNLARLRSAKGNSVVRLALRAGHRPQKRTLKSLVRNITRMSTQSVGATTRAMDSKVSYPARGKKHYGFGISSVSKKHVEFKKRPHAIERSTLYASKVEVTPRKKDVTSRIKNKIVPRNYWHLIDKGFDHRSGTAVAGYDFTRQAFSGSSAEATAKFDTKLAEGLQRELSR